MTILGDKILWKPFNYGVNCHQIELRSNSAFIFTVTATSEGPLTLLDGCLCLLGGIFRVLNMLLAQCFERLIVYILSFTVEIPLGQCWKHHKVNNDSFSILWHRLGVPFQPLGVLVGVWDSCTVGTTWEQLSCLPDAQGLSGKSAVWCRSNSRGHKTSSPGVLNLFLRHYIDEVHGSCGRWTFGCFVFFNQRNAGYDSQ